MFSNLKALQGTFDIFCSLLGGCVAAALRRGAGAVAGMTALCALVSALFWLPATQAGDFKPDQPCSALKDGDVTRTGNNKCMPAAAIYVDQFGDWMYIELISDHAPDGTLKKLFEDRIIQVAPKCKKLGKNPNADSALKCGEFDFRGACAQIENTCNPGCGKPSCFVCLGTRCGCVC